MNRHPYKVEPVCDYNYTVIGYAVIDRETRKRVGTITDNSLACGLCQFLNRLANVI